MAFGEKKRSLSARENFMRATMLASAEIALVATGAMLFLLYSFGQETILSVFLLAVMLLCSILIRRSVQSAQIILLLSVILMEFIIVINVGSRIPFIDFVGPEVLTPMFVIFDLVLVFSLVRNWGLSGETAN